MKQSNYAVFSLVHVVIFKLKKSVCISFEKQMKFNQIIKRHWSDLERLLKYFSNTLYIEKTQSNVDLCYSGKCISIQVKIHILLKVSKVKLRWKYGSKQYKPKNAKWDPTNLTNQISKSKAKRINEHNIRWRITYIIDKITPPKKTEWI